MKSVNLLLNRTQKALALYIYWLQYAMIVAGRGTGKSFIVAYIIHIVLKFMPRSKWLIVGETYKSMLESTLPSTLAALEKFNYFRDVHYVVGIKPPDSWDKPFQAVAKGYANTISFWNGTVFHLVSQDSGATSPRSLNADGIINDEALNLDKEKYDQDIAPTLRGNGDHFGHLPFHHAEFFFTSPPYGSESEWIWNVSKYYENDGFDYETIFNQLIDLQVEFIDERSKAQRQLIYKDIVIKQKELKFYTKDGVYFSQSNCFDNIRVIGLDYLEKRRRTMSDLSFTVEIMGKRQGKIEGGFYAKLDRQIHGYKGTWLNDSLGQFNNSALENLAGEGLNIDENILKSSLFDRDCISTLPLRIGVDWGGNINSLVVGQKLDSMRQFNLINCFHAKWPETLEAVFHQFGEYYRFHGNKLIYFYYDRNGNSKVANSELTYAEQAAEVLRGYGFDVIPMTSGLDAFHNDKYLLFNMLLAEATTSLPRLRFNVYNFRGALISMENTPIKEVEGKIKKNKGEEGKHLETEERATHYGDAFDSLVWGEFKDLLETESAFFSTVYR